MLPHTFTWLPVCMLFTSGCAFGAQQSEPHAPTAALPNDYAWPPKVLTPEEAQAPHRRAHTAWRAPSRQLARSIDSNESTAVIPIAPPPAVGGCLEVLDSADVSYQVLDAKRGVVTPILLKDELGGIRYVPTGGLPLIVDCRFAVTLLRISPVLRELGVSALHYSGAYVYRMSSKGRLSLHANGLAIDIHEVTIDGEQLSVKRHFARGLGDACASNLPPLNRVACHLKRTRAFRELLTPDYDANHHDHFHLAISQSSATR